MTTDTLITSDDLIHSGTLVKALFATNYPEGLTLQQMLDSGIGWIIEAAKLIIGGENHGSRSID